MPRRLVRLLLIFTSLLAAAPAALAQTGSSIPGRETLTFAQLSPSEVVVEWADDLTVGSGAFVPEDRARFANLVRIKSLDKFARLARSNGRPVRVGVRIYALGQQHNLFSQTAVNFVAAEVSIVDVQTGETLGTAPEVTGTLPENVSPIGRLFGGNPFIQDRTDWLAGSLANGVRESWGND